MDRGIKFNWHTGSAKKTGFFGYDDSASEFVFIADATDNSNTFTGTASNLRVGDIAGGAIVGTSLTGASGASITEFSTDGTLAGNSDTATPTEKAVKTYVDTQLTAKDLDIQGDSGGAHAIDLDSETLTIAG